MPSLSGALQSFGTHVNVDGVNIPFVPQVNFLSDTV
jgi:hypothetical protein